MSDYIKKGSFNIMWFVVPFEEKFGKITDLSNKDKSVIKSLYNTYYLDYYKFIQNIKIYFGDNRTDEYLYNEEYCKKCNNNYPIHDYLFVDIFHNNNDLTFKLCKKCTHQIKYLKCTCGKNSIYSKLISVDINFNKIKCDNCLD